MSEKFRITITGYMDFSEDQPGEDMENFRRTVEDEVINYGAYNVQTRIEDEYCIDKNDQQVISKLGGWIPCRERLPEGDENILVFDKFEGIQIGFKRSDNLVGWVDEQRSAFMYYGVTHWMSLPTSPATAI